MIGQFNGDFGHDLALLGVNFIVGGAILYPCAIALRWLGLQLIKRGY